MVLVLALGFSSGFLLIYGLNLLILLEFLCRWEESQLVERFGEAYIRYRRRVRRWLPRLTPFQDIAEKESSTS